MRSHFDVLVAATWLLFASVGCGNDKAGSEAPANTGGNSGSAAMGSSRASTLTDPPGSGSGGTTGKVPNNSNSTGGKTPTGTGGEASKGNDGNGATGGKSATAANGTTGGKRATGDGGSANAMGGSTPKGGSPSTGAGPASGGTASTTGPCTTYGKPEQVGAVGITTSDKTQISGIVASRDNPGVLYAQADSGQPVIHAMDLTGKLLGSMTLNVTPKDWEDLAIGINQGGADYLYVGDIGDNAARTGSGSPRTSILVYRFPEPAKADFSTAAPLSIPGLEKAEFTYPEGAHDAETLMVDPTTQDLLVLTKDENGKSIVYRAPDTAFKGGTPTELEEIVSISTGTAGQLSSQVSAGDISPSGDAILLRTYGSILLFPRLPTWTQTFAATPVTLPSPTEQQGEGLTFTSDGSAWICAGETSTTLYSAEAACK